MDSGHTQAKLASRCRAWLVHLDTSAIKLEYRTLPVTNVQNIPIVSTALQPFVVPVFIAKLGQVRNCLVHLGFIVPVALPRLHAKKVIIVRAGEMFKPHVPKVTAVTQRNFICLSRVSPERTNRSLVRYHVSIALLDVTVTKLQ